MYRTGFCCRVVTKLIELPDEPDQTSHLQQEQLRTAAHCTAPRPPCGVRAQTICRLSRWHKRRRGALVTRSSALGLSLCLGRAHVDKSGGFTSVTGRRSSDCWCAYAAPAAGRHLPCPSTTVDSLPPLPLLGAGAGALTRAFASNTTHTHLHHISLMVRTHTLPLYYASIPTYCICSALDAILNTGVTPPLARSQRPCPRVSHVV